MILEPRLASGETVQWRGSPDPRVNFTRTDSFFIPFSILWLAFAVFWTTAVSSSPTAPSFIWVFGLVFVAIGIFLTVGRFFVKAATKRQTRYILTNRRAIVTGPWGVNSMYWNDAAIFQQMRPGGSHVDVVFGPSSGPMNWMPGMSNLTLYANTGMDFFAVLGPGLPMAFYDVSDDVWDAVRRARLEPLIRSLPDQLDTMVGDSGAWHARRAAGCGWAVRGTAPHPVRGADERCGR